MAYERLGLKSFGYENVRYGQSKLDFRGPRRNLDTGYIACLGGTETYGKFIKQPFPDLIERELGLTCVNFGRNNAGIDASLCDAGLMEICQRARAIVLQVPGSINFSNPFYKVHPRRNDRFLQATPRLRRLFPEVDFTEFHFTRHLIRSLNLIAPERFPVLRDGLQEHWVERMQELLERITVPVVLFCFSRQPLGMGNLSSDVEDDPTFVSRAMLNAIGSRASAVVEVVISRTARRQGTRGMVFAPLEISTASSLPNPQAHAEAAAALVPALKRLI